MCLTWLSLYSGTLRTSYQAKQRLQRVVHHMCFQPETSRRTVNSEIIFSIDFYLALHSALVSAALHYRMLPHLFSIVAAPVIRKCPQYTKLLINLVFFSSRLLFVSKSTHTHLGVSARLFYVLHAPTWLARAHSHNSANTQN